MTGIGVVVVLTATAFLVGSRADVDTTAAPLTASAEPQTPAVAGPRPAERVNEARTPPPRRSPGTGTRRFAWPPVAGASGYQVELFKGSALILRDGTTKPEILIRARWRFNGRRHRLEPGAYRWYVWPVVDGQRNTKAVVQAKLVVPR